MTPAPPVSPKSPNTADVAGSPPSHRFSFLSPMISSPFFITRIAVAVPFPITASSPLASSSAPATPLAPPGISSKAFPFLRNSFGPPAACTRISADLSPSTSTAETRDASFTGNVPTWANPAGNNFPSSHFTSIFSFPCF